MNTDPVKIIKKYKNRRLYDTETSQYVTIETLHQYVIKNQPFRVVDSLNGNDLTNLTLLQILMEMENQASTQFLSPEIIRQLIIFAHHPAGQFFKGAVEQLFGNFEKNMQSNPYIKDYQSVARFWNDQIKNIFTQ